jgi:hypothetical protein
VDCPCNGCRRDAQSAAEASMKDRIVSFVPLISVKGTPLQGPCLCALSEHLSGKHAPGPPSARCLGRRFCPAQQGESFSMAGTQTVPCTCLLVCGRNVTTVMSCSPAAFTGAESPTNGKYRWHSRSKNAGQGLSRYGEKYARLPSCCPDYIIDMMT